MNKITLLAAGSLMMMTGMTSCLGGNGSENNSVTETYPSMYFAAANADGTVSFSKTISSGRYTRGTTTTLQTEISIPGLSVNGNAVGVKTKNIPAVEGVYPYEKLGYMYNLIGGTTIFPGYDIVDVSAIGTESITSFRADVTQMVFNNVLSMVQNLPLGETGIQTPDGTSQAGRISYYAFMSFKYGADVQVYSFWPDLLYVGETITNYPGQTEGYKNQDIVYRVVMKDFDKGENAAKADVYFYNAKFADVASMPTLNFVLRDLTLKFDRYGFHITGENVVPMMLKENVENPKYTFKTFRFENTAPSSANGYSLNVMSVTCQYKVGDNFNGRFIGNSGLQPESYKEEQ